VGDGGGGEIGKKWRRMWGVGGEGWVDGRGGDKGGEESGGRWERAGENR